jgi:sugar phosphate isomerase/epimerase
MMNRRTFLKSAAAVAIGWRAASADSDRRVQRIGLQLYTVREQMQQDFEGSLAKVAAVGYQEVEFAGYFGCTPEQVRSLVDRHRLVPVSAHIPLAQIRTNWEEVLEAACIIGHDYVVCPWVDEAERRTLDDWKRHAELFNRAGEASQRHAIHFAYHNHDFEFDPIQGKLPYDLLLAETDPKLVKFEMDLYWITKGRQDPLAYFARHPGRFPMVHVKDMDKASGRSFADLGKGTIDFRRIFAQSAQAGIEHYFVEHDQPASAFDSIRISYEYLKRMRF